MTHTITISSATGARALLAALFAGSVLLAARAFRNALTGLKTARQWLNTRHEFYAQDGDPIKCTGWQFVSYNIIATVVVVLLSIKY